VGDETPTARRRTSREFDEIEQRALRSFIPVWDGFAQSQRMTFAADWARLVKHVDVADQRAAAAAKAASETLATRRFKATLRWSAIAALVAAAQIGAAFVTQSHPTAPQTVIVKFPSGQQVTITPLPSPSFTPLPGGNP
jgi:hypothetical protein